MKTLLVLRHSFVRPVADKDDLDLGDDIDNVEVRDTGGIRHILKDNSANLLHTGDNKKADKWLDDIRWTVMVFDVTFVCEGILRSHQSEVN